MSINIPRTTPDHVPCGCMGDEHGMIVCDKHLQELNKMTNAQGTLNFQTKDSGQRQEFSTGMVRDVQTDKPRYDLLHLPMLKRWAELMARGAKKYGENNWKKAATEEELSRFKSSALRHMFQYLEGDTSEDHSAAVFFNLAGAEMVKYKIESESIRKITYPSLPQNQQDFHPF